MRKIFHSKSAFKLDVDHLHYRRLMAYTAKLLMAIGIIKPHGYTNLGLSEKSP